MKFKVYYKREIDRLSNLYKSMSDTVSRYEGECIENEKKNEYAAAIEKVKSFLESSYAFKENIDIINSSKYQSSSIAIGEYLGEHFRIRIAKSRKPGDYIDISSVISDKDNSRVWYIKNSFTEEKFSTYDEGKALDFFDSQFK